MSPEPSSSATSVRALGSASAQRGRVFENGCWTALVTAGGCGALALVAWLFYALQVGSVPSASRASGSFLVLVMAVAITASAASATFAAAWLVLRTLQRSAAIED